MVNAFESLILTGRTLSLQSLTELEVPTLAAALADPISWYAQKFDLRTPSSCEKMLTRLVTQRHQKTQHPLLIRWQKQIAGLTVIRRVDTANRCVELGGTWIATPFRRSTVNVESKLLLLQLCFKEWSCGSVYWTVAKSNPYSARALENLGFQLDGCLRNRALYPDGTFDDVFYYSVTDEDWPQVEKRMKKVFSSRLKSQPLQTV